VKTISREDLKEMIDRGDEFVLLEVLSEASYGRAHLPGAIRFQNMDSIPDLLPDKNTKVVAYCSNFNWHSSTRVVRELTAMGYENAFEYEGGKQDWMDADYPTESGWKAPAPKPSDRDGSSRAVNSLTILSTAKVDIARTGRRLLLRIAVIRGQKMVEGQRREDVLSGVHPVLPSLALAFKRMVATIERESGIGGMKWFLLTVLGRRDGLSQGEFTQEYEMDPSRVTRTAQSLEGDGLIRRERDVKDNRVMRMYLTEDGREVLRRLPEINEQLRRRVHSVLSEEEFEELRRMLGLLAEAMKSESEGERERISR
jgi:DNA-binding MarR family transcriptional regulator/rhodanese-related sulfurtransferase